ncbi:hypothetical protein BJ170DRAFT_736528 [Xylariales sp. AK1849]|nr:hypothetical protein BJ170DRAFT_736528 [Xylariales sp. AK1849]
MTTNTQLPAAILAINILLSLPAVYLIYKHGLRHGSILGWGYLFIFVMLRIVSSAMQLGNPTDPSASLIASIGLSPLLLAALGILHESRAYCIANRNRLFDLIWVVVLHFVITTAVALTGSGASGASKPTATPDERAGSLNLVKVGMILLLLSWITFSALAVFSFIQAPRRSSHKLPFLQYGKWLLDAVLVAIPFIGIRVITSLVYFTTQNPALNPSTGEIGYRVGLGFIEELVVSIGFVVVGILTRNIGKPPSTGTTEAIQVRK